MSDEAPCDLGELVRRAVRAIPAGRVATYGDVAELIGCGPRQVGRIMATDAADTPWWRVVNAAGRMPGHLLAEAREHWDAEGMQLNRDATGVLLARCRVAPERWASRVDPD